ncbi:MAG TPA: alcohol dehydrogenase catalytic domain-containing protein, partial [Anaerolineales bacterium]
YGLGLALGRWFPGVLWSGLSCTVLREVPEPSLPGPDWVKVKTRLGGICGTDLGAIYLKTSPYYSPFSSFPFTFGHENLGFISEGGKDVTGWKVGQRVVVNPLLACEARGFKDLCEFCAKGEVNRCERFTQGALAPAIMTGAARDTGGSWSAAFVAHHSQLYAVPDSVSDENALMVEPFCCGLHAVLIDFPKDEETILILGAGTMGLVTLAALRALGSRARILVSARYANQAEAAQRLGATEVLRRGDLYAQVAERTGARVLKATIGKRVVEGGVHRVYECTGSDSSLDDANRLARSGGKVVLVGIPAIAKGVDWTAIFSQELTVLAARQFNNAELIQGKKWRCFDLALDLMARGKVDLGWMVSRKYALADYKQALSDLAEKGSQGIIKAVFEFPQL